MTAQQTGHRQLPKVMNINVYNLNKPVLACRWPEKLLNTGEKIDLHIVTKWNATLPNPETVPSYKSVLK